MYIKHSDINWSAFVTLGEKLIGKPYKFGAEVNLTDGDPTKILAIDCSELVEWLYTQLKKIDGSQATLFMPDGSYNQAKMCTHVDVSHLLIGDLGFKWWPDTQVIHHVGVYIGNNKILEAKGRAWGTIVTSVENYMRSDQFAFFGRHPKIEDA